MKTTQEKIAIMQAFVDGKPIEYYNTHDKWVPCPDPRWEWGLFNFRIKEDMELKAWNSHPNNQLHHLHDVPKVGRTWMRTIIDAVKRGDIT